MAFADDFVAEDAYLALSKLQGGLSVGSVTGCTYWVDNSDSDAADSEGRGTVTAPFATIDYAIGQCTPSRGDVILVKSGHDETISADAAIDCDVAGIAIRGLGRGVSRPIIRFDNTAATLEIAAAGVQIQNIRFLCEISALAKFINIVTGGNGAIIEGCNFQFDSATNEATKSIVLTNAVPDVEILRNDFLYLSATDASTHCIHCAAGNTHRLKVAHNTIFGEFTTGLLVMTTGNDLRVYDNKFVNTQTTDIAGLVDATSANGVVCDNRGWHGYATDLDVAISFGGAVCENYVQNAASESGGIAPPTRST